MRVIERVRVSHGGDPLLGRVLEVRTSVDDFETPTRTPTSTELNARARLHFDEPWDNTVFEVVNRFDDRSPVHLLHRRNGVFAQRRRVLASMVERFKGYSVVKYFPQVPHDTSLDGRDVRSLVDLQVEAGCDIISIPEPSAGCSVQELEGNLQRMWEYVQSTDGDLAVIPYISLRQDHELFEAKLRLLREFPRDLWCIGIRAASFSEYRPNLYSLAEGCDQDQWVHLSGGRRYTSHRRPNGQLHALQRFGVDTVSVEVPQGGGFRVRDPGMIRYFERGSCTYPRVAELVQGDRPLPCECPMCRSMRFPDLVSDVRPLGPEDELVLRVNDAFRVHEVYSSTMEFEVSRDVIRNGMLEDYYSGKAGLREYSFPSYVRTASLDDF
mgnify:CR=1 FL=1